MNTRTTRTVTFEAQDIADILCRRVLEKENLKKEGFVSEALCTFRLENVNGNIKLVSADVKFDI